MAAQRENENFRFRVFLKGKDGDKVDEIVHRLHTEITPQIDCTSCGNRCCQLKPQLSKKDISVLAKKENITTKDYLLNYCEDEGFGDIYLKTLPCRYLNEKSCSLSDNRPDQCKRFPYTNQKGFTSRLFGMLTFYEICPIVFNLMERLKGEMRFRK